MTYSKLSKEIDQLSYRDKFRLAQLLIQLARKEEEEQNPEQRQKPGPVAELDPELIQYVADRLRKLKPSKKEALLNSISAMFQFQGGISPWPTHGLHVQIAALRSLRCCTPLTPIVQAGFIGPVVTCTVSAVMTKSRALSVTIATLNRTSLVRPNLAKAGWSRAARSTLTVDGLSPQSQERSYVVSGFMGGLDETNRSFISVGFRGGSLFNGKLIARANT